MKTVLITGATGFVGRAFIKKLKLSESYKIIVAIRKVDTTLISDSYLYIPELSSRTKWPFQEVSIDIIVHLAAKAHSRASLECLLEVNAGATINLAKQASEAGVKRMIFLSTIGVNGNTSTKPLDETCPEKPHNDYSFSKQQAEIGLLNIANSSSLEVVILRAPLIYGPNAPGNFNKLFKLVRLGLPLPFRSINNSRSFISIDNLIDLLTVCLDHPSASNQTFLISDNDDLATSQLIKYIGVSIKKRVILFPFPKFLFEKILIFMGNRKLAESLFSDMQINSAKVRKSLNWDSKVGVEESILNIGKDEKL